MATRNQRDPVTFAGEFRWSPKFHNVYQILPSISLYCIWFAFRPSFAISRFEVQERMFSSNFCLLSNAAVPYIRKGRLARYSWVSFAFVLKTISNSASSGPNPVSSRVCSRHTVSVSKAMHHFLVLQKIRWLPDWNLQPEFLAESSGSTHGLSDRTKCLEKIENFSIFRNTPENWRSENSLHLLNLIA